MNQILARFPAQSNIVVVGVDGSIEEIYADNICRAPETPLKGMQMLAKPVAVNCSCLQGIATSEIRAIRFPIG